MIFNSATPRSRVIDIPMGIEILLRLHYFSFSFIIIIIITIFFYHSVLVKTTRATLNERKPHLLFHPSGGIAGKSHRPGGPLAVAVAPQV